MFKEILEQYGLEAVAEELLVTLTVAAWFLGLGLCILRSKEPKLSRNQQIAHIRLGVSGVELPTAFSCGSNQ